MIFDINYYILVVSSLIRSKKMKEAIINVNIAGGVGKSLVSSAIVEELRRFKTVDAYTCDENNQDLYNRLGDKKKPSIQNDPSKGVKYIDLRDPEIKREIIDALTSDAEVVFFDFPADSLGAFTKLAETKEDLVDMFDMSDRRMNLLTVIADDKSLDSYVTIKEFFPTARHIAAVNEGLMKEKKLERTLLPNAIKIIGEGEHFIIRTQLTKPALEAYANHTMRQVALPKDEREYETGKFNPPLTTLIKSPYDIKPMETFITTMRDATATLFP